MGASVRYVIIIYPDFLQVKGFLLKTAFTGIHSLWVLPLRWE